VLAAPFSAPMAAGNTEKKSMQIRHVPIPLSLIVALVSLCLAGLTQAEAQCSQDARSTAAKFLRVSYDGSFIGVVPAFAEMQGLLMDDGVPPAWPVVVTRTYKITDAAPVKAACRYTAVFSNYGYITEADVFHHEMRDEVAHIWVSCSDRQCKVDMDAHHYGLPPHAGKEAVLTWLRKLRSVNDNPKRKSLETEVDSLR